MIPVVYVARQRGGLCNNLKCYLSASRMAARQDARVTTDCEDLLTLHRNLVVADPADRNTRPIDVHSWRLAVMPEDDLPAGFARSPESRGFADADPDGRNIDFEYQRIPPLLRRNYLDQLETLTPKSHLMEIVRTFAAERFGPDTVSMHLRTWLTDHWDRAPKRNARYYDEAAYRRVIERHPDRTIFLSADNASHASRLVADYGDRLITWDTDASLSAVESAYINLRLLGSNGHIVGSRLSTFTEMAWWYTGCRATVTLL